MRHIHTSARPPHQGTASPQSHAPNAALLIDFDNVTMGIRSDLTRELRNLLDSEVIRGKVAVQRAYADWRRYPQYIVSLSEASIDLIFAPAYGSSKKNATDIRLAIDALELVFTRPEIGTFILLSGDSDFSSLVLKLKEYGKYVIGVGIRESASDLLVQNCDEYYSYSGLTGLTAAAEDGGERHDPWELVERAVLRMEKNGDVMRSDRLKQVMIEMDPAFDEKELGFTKYNKFLTEAASKNRLSLTKLDNGQYEVGAPGKAGQSSDDRDDRPSRGRGGRGRDRGRRGARRNGETRDERPTVEARDERPTGEARVEGPTGEARVEGPTGEARVERPTSEARVERPTGEARVERPARRERAAPAPESSSAAPAAAPGGGAEDGEAYAFRLLARAVADIGEGKDPVRDSELKRRMIEIDPGWDEATLGFSKFSRFLRRAHDEEVIDLHRTPEGHYEAVLGGNAAGYRDGSGKTRDRGQAPAPRSRRDAGERASRAGARGRDDSRSDRDGAGAAAPRAGAGVDDSRGDEVGEDASPRDAVGDAAAREDGAAATGRKAAAAGGNGAERAAPEPREAPASAPTERPRSWGRSRRGGAPSGPPPVLPGQAVGSGQGGAAGAAPTVDDSTADGPPEGLPEERSEVIRYLVSRYKGVGERTASTVVDAFGPAEVFRVLGDEPERVRDLVGPARAQMLIDGWQADARRR